MKKILVTTVIVVAVMMVAAGAWAQSPPPARGFSMNSPAGANLLTQEGVTDTKVGYRFSDQTIGVVIPDTTPLTPDTLNTIDQVLWRTERFHFHYLDVENSSVRLSHQSYAELAQNLGARPPGYEIMSLATYGRALNKLDPVIGADSGGTVAWLWTILVVVGVIAVMLLFLAVLFMLVSAAWRRRRATHPESTIPAERAAR
jgi:flagellar basal body-associated protein FliL